MLTKVIIILPAYNAEKTIISVYKKIPAQYKKNVILVDDGSADRTSDCAKDLGIQTYKHDSNKGYGANQKTCYQKAKKLGFDIVIMLHPDGQHDPKYIPKFVEKVISEKADVVLGSRLQKVRDAHRGGMPISKIIMNRILTLVNNALLGTNLTDHLSGYRAYSWKALHTIKYQRFSNDFLFDQQMLMKSVDKKLTITEIPVSTHYYLGSSALVGLRGLHYAIISLVESATYFLRKRKT